jgi:hypothetical protein
LKHPTQRENLVEAGKAHLGRDVVLFERQKKKVTYVVI